MEKETEKCKIIEENENEPGYLKFRVDNGEIMHWRNVVK